MSLPPSGDNNGFNKYVSQLDAEIKKSKTKIADMIAEMNRLHAMGDEIGAKREASGVYITKQYIENLCVSRTAILNAITAVKNAESARALSFALDNMRLG